MGRLVQVMADRRAVLLPDGVVHRSGEQVVLSDPQYALVPSGWIGTMITDLGPTSYPTEPPTDAAAGTASLRTLGSGATQAAAGNHTHVGGGGGSGAAVGTATPQPLGVAAAGTADAASHEDHVHAAPPTDPAAGTAGLRTLGATSTTAAAGNHTHSGTYDPAGTAATAVAAIPSGGSAGTPALRALGTSGTTAAAGNDSRLSDSRTPTAHATSHASAGSDPVTPAAIGASATGHTHAAAGPRLVHALVTSGSAGGDTPASTSGAWARYTPVGTLAIDAVVGDYVEVLLALLTNRSDTALLFDVAVYVGGSAVWYASTETATPATEGDPALYPTLSPRGWYGGLVVASGHLSGGQVTFGLGHKSAASGKLYYSTDYPMRWRALNYGAPTP